MLRFQSQSEFQTTLRKRVREYLKENNLSGKADYRFYVKAVANLAIYLAPFIIWLVFKPGVWGTIGLFAITGVGMAGVGMNLMHDALHDTVTKSEWWNRRMGAVLYLLTGNSYTWKTQHNVKHHTHTNLEGMDDDIDAGSILRLHPEQPLKKAHKYQHIYAPFAYTLMTLKWLFQKDFSQVVEYGYSDVYKAKDQSITSVWIKLIVGKAIHFSVFYVLPLALGVVWYKVLIANLVMHVMAGTILSFIFQMAHVVDRVQFPSAEEAKNDSLLEHQLKTTANFGNKSRIVTWFTGGLNFQVEHHLFPSINHVHYPKIAEIVKKTAAEFNLPYNEYKTFASALKGHFRHLRYMGNTAIA